MLTSRGGGLKRYPHVACLCLGGLALATCTAQAVPVTWVLSGRIETKNDYYGIANDLAIGDVVTYSVVFDSEQANQSTIAEIGYFPSLSASLQVGPREVECTATFLELRGNAAPLPPSRFDLPIHGETAGIRYGGSFRLRDYDLTAIPNPDVLPGAPYDLSVFENRELSLLVEDLSGYSLFAVLTGSISNWTIVPEPSTATIGILFLVCACWHKQTQYRYRSS